MFCVHSKGDKLKGGETLYWSRQNEGTPQCLRHQASPGQGLKPNPELLTHSQSPSSKILKITVKSPSIAMTQAWMHPCYLGLGTDNRADLGRLWHSATASQGSYTGAPPLHSLSLSQLKKIYKTKPCYPFQKCCSEQREVL